MLKFYNIHGHSSFSLYDAIGTPEDYIKWLLENAGESSGGFALTDHGNMNNVGYVAAANKKYRQKGAPVKVAYGNELYYLPSIEEWRQLKIEEDKRKKEEKAKSKTKKDTSEDSLFVENEAESKMKKYWNPINRRNHLVLVAINQKGLQNLFRITSQSYMDGMYRKPRCDLEMLRKYNEGLIACSSCLAGVPSMNSLLYKEQGQEKVFEGYDKELLPMMEIFGPERFYLELQFNKIPEQQIVNLDLIEYAKRTGYKLIATADCHHPTPELYKDRDLYKALGYQLLKQDVNTDILEKDLDEIDCHLYLKNGDQMFDAYKEEFAKHYKDEQVIKDAIERTYDIGHNLIEDFDPDDTPKMPSVYINKEKYKDSFDYLKQYCFDELKKRKLTTKEYAQRLVKELKVIKQLNVVDYFLAQKKILDVVRKGMLAGPGRGSGTSSIVNYLLDITFIDPIKNDLIFERFLSLARAGLPDIDSDISNKDEAFKYLQEEFGEENVLAVSNYNRLQLKSLIKDISRLYKVPFEEVNIVTKNIEHEAKDKIMKEVNNDQKLYELTYERAIKYSPSLKEFINKYPKVGEHITNLYQEIKSISRHAGGVLVVPDAQSHVPIIRIRKTNQCPITEGITAQHLQSFGLIKFDLLGLNTLRVIHRCIEIILQKRGNVNVQMQHVWNFYNKHLHPDVIDPADENVFKNIYHKGKFLQIFQFTEKGVQEFCRKAKPLSVNDISAITALWRPGPLNAGADKEYIKRRKKKDINFSHSILKEALGPTKGLLCIREDQEITLSDRTAKKIQNIKKYDKVISGEGSVVTVIGVSNNGLKQTFTYETDGPSFANKLSSTSDHKVRQFLYYKPIKETDYLLRYRYKKNKIYKKISNPYLLGLVVAEGCLGQSSPVITCGTEKDAKIIKEYIQNSFKKNKAKHYHHCRAWYVASCRDNGNYRSEFKSWLKKYNLLNVSREGKITPSCLLGASDKDICKYLAGYIDGDGRIAQDVVSFACGYEKGREMLCKLLDIVKISYYTCGHLIIIRDRELFNKKIFPYCVLKAHNKFKANIVGKIKISKKYIKEIIDKERQNVSVKKFLKSKNISPSLYWKKGETIKIDTLLRLLNERERKLFLSNYVRGDFSIQKIRNRTSDGFNKVYDLTIREKDHSFLASCFAVHNCYQEQFMELAHKLGGFSLEESDKLRKFLVKPSHELGVELLEKRKEYRQKFIDGCVNSGLDEKDATQLWDKDIAGFVSYGFAKAHAQAYAYNSYHCAWLMTYHEEEWIEACLEEADGPKLEKIINDVRKLGYSIENPDVNHSFTQEWVVKNKKCRPALSAIKGVGLTAGDELVEKRRTNNGFEDLEDFLYTQEDKWRWSKFNKRCLAAVIQTEGFKSLGCIGKTKLFKNYKHMHDAIIENYDKLKKKKMTLKEAADSVSSEDWSPVEKVKIRENLFGYKDLYILFKPYLKIMKRHSVDPIDAEEEDGPKKMVWFIINKVVEKKTKTGKPFVNLYCYGLTSKEYMIRLWNRKKDEILQEGNILLANIDYDPKWGYSTKSKLVCLNQFEKGEGSDS